MFIVMVWFIAMILLVTGLFLVENYFRNIQPGYHRTYILQPVFDMIKLFGKKDQSNLTFTRWFSIGALWFSLLSLWLTLSGEHFLLVMSGLAMMELFVLLGAGSAKELFGSMAAQRGITRYLVWSFTCMVVAASLYRITGTLNLGQILEITDPGILVKHLPLTFMALFIVLMIKSNLWGFDFGIIGKEMSFLGAGLYTPYSGWNLAVIQLAQWVEVGVWLKLVSVFLPWKPWLSLIIAAIAYLAVLLLDAFIPKAAWKKVVRHAWIWAGGLSVVNYIWLYLI